MIKHVCCFLISAVCAIAFISYAQMGSDGNAEVATEASADSSIRDPFWPVGYEPGAEEEARRLEEADAARRKKEAEAARRMRESALSRVGPVTEQEWEAAEKNLPRQSSVFKATKPDGNTQDFKMILDGKGYFAGDNICFTNDIVEFVWKIDSISFSPARFEKTRVSAKRIISPNN